MADILIRRYGYDYGSCQTLEEVGRHYKVTREYIRQLQDKAEMVIAMFTIEKDIPIPAFNGANHSHTKELTETLNAMNPSDSFVAPRTYQKLLPTIARARGWVIVSRKISDTEMRVWLLSKSRDGN